MRWSMMAVLAMLALGASAQTQRFAGAWFEVEYPTGFTARGSQKSETKEGYESAFFTSPDGEVEFYIFSPQWSGQADDIARQPSEKEVSRQVAKGKLRTVTHWTIAARDSSYLRSYQETRTESTVWIVGVKYRSHAAYNRHKKDYLAFKASLVQYAD